MTQRMQREPEVRWCDAQPYVGIRRAVTMTTIDQLADRIPEIVGWLAARGTDVAAAPFLRFHVIDMERELLVEAGVPVDEPVGGDDETLGDGGLTAGTLPEGRYLCVTHVGHPDELVQVTGELLAWAQAHGLVFDTWDTPDGLAWRSRLEVYRSDPRDEPDPGRWETELAFRLVDGD